MELSYHTNHLLLQVLNQEAAPLTLAFYQQNRERFEAVEPIINEDFYTLEHQQNLLTYEFQETLRLHMIRFWISLPEDPDVLIGTICYHNIRRPVFSCCSVGYKMDYRYTHRGYCREALAFGNQLMFQELGLHRIEALVMPSNQNSISLLESLNFHQEGLLRDKILLQNQWQDHFLYALIQE